MANIAADVLHTLAPALRPRLTATGVLILSGILATQVDELRAAYERAGLRVEARADEGEWAALRLSPGPV